jgi:general secretion pathway protein H
MVALAIAALIMAVAVPSSVRFYEGMQRRQAVRDTVSLLAAAREQALSSGRTQDVNVRPSDRRIWLGEKNQTLPRGLGLTVHGAAELNRDNIGVIRFYPDGSASGGGVDIRRSDGSGTRISVDWLMGRVQQEALSQGRAA